MIEYVLVLAAVKDDNNQVLIIEKQKPEWQRGRYNLVGGKVEEGENPLEAAIRELWEESGLVSQLPAEYMGQISCGLEGPIIHCCRIWVEKKELTPQPEEIEKVFWTTYDIIKDDERLMPNLRVIIPLMVMGLTNWVVIDYGPNWHQPTHQFAVEVLSSTKSFT